MARKRSKSKRKPRRAKRRAAPKAARTAAKRPFARVPPLEETQKYGNVQGSTWTLVGFTVVLFVIALGVALVSPMLERAAPDADLDGVANVRDICPDTTRGAIVDPRGCSFEQVQVREGLDLDYFEKRIQLP